MRLLALLLLAAAPAPAQEADRRTFQPPAGCTAYLTVQGTSCTVSHHFTCEADPEGWQRRVDMDEGGITYFGAIDAQTQWMESFHVLAGTSERLEPAPADPASFDTLTATGLDTFDFRTLSDELGETRYAGQDRLTGETVEIDGVPLERTEFQVRVTDATGAEVWRTEGREFISRDWRMFLSGVSTVTTPEETYTLDNTPMEFVFPGEPGFLSVSPKYGCGAVMSGLPSPGGQG